MEVTARICSILTGDVLNKLEVAKYAMKTCDVKVGD
jgi:hypothetical protein